jgi:rRNA-processing protein FCF1
MLPAGVADLLLDHEVVTVQRAGFKGLKNGQLIRNAVAQQFDVLLTSDRNLPAQQNITVSGIAVILVRGSRMVELAPLAGRIAAAIERAEPGMVVRVEPR